ncbi:1-acyl-sn-glycerol-3-phosphate acyltransferase [Microbacterium sp. BWT-B31]|uniref:1-acyl-sn-glycerol-3-phosphate acyltransferase n=1 Tax=Microbacterium sp. BWT-B31 TaxID=3232072 RepID=UPI003526F7FB
MMRVPPRWVRRVVFAPVVVALGLVLLVLIPLGWVAFFALLALIPGHMRIPRVLWLVFVYLVWDAALLLALFGLWIGSGFGWKLRSPAFVRAHYRLGGLALRALFWIFGSVLRLDIVTTGSDDPDRDVAHAAFVELFDQSRPIVVASRHGGPGDSFIVVHTMLNGVGRMPRIVLKDTLQWDPAIDVLLNRIPTRFIVPSGFGTSRAASGRAAEQQIAALAAGLGPEAALVIFPEGGQASPRRRRSRIARLRAAGRRDMARRAEALRHVMPPQPGGVHAALTGAPDADMVLIAHTGLERLATMRDLWRELPMGKRITLRAWLIPRETIPADPEAQAEWLFAWFERIDRWIDEHGDHADRGAPDEHVAG